VPIRKKTLSQKRNLTKILLKKIVSTPSKDFQNLLVGSFR